MLELLLVLGARHKTREGGISNGRQKSILQRSVMHIRFELARRHVDKNFQLSTASRPHPLKLVNWAS